MNTFDKVYSFVSKVPKGKVTTYGAIAKIVGADPRVIGFALHANSDPKNIPCHRVINSKGQISKGFAFGGPDIQKDMVEKEGIMFVENKCDLKKFGYLI
jgi:methylated-DNA-protein-cysteine methyltransferase-like protein